jgi:hypothetical protein
MVSCRQFFADELKAINKRLAAGAVVITCSCGYASDPVDAIRVAMNRKKTVLIALLAAFLAGSRRRLGSG